MAKPKEDNSDNLEVLLAKDTTWDNVRFSTAFKFKGWLRRFYQEIDGMRLAEGNLFRGNRPIGYDLRSRKIVSRLPQAIFTPEFYCYNKDDDKRIKRINGVNLKHLVLGEDCQTLYSIVTGEKMIKSPHKIFNREVIALESRILIPRLDEKTFMELGTRKVVCELPQKLDRTNHPGLTLISHEDKGGGVLGLAEDQETFYNLENGEEALKFSKKVWAGLNVGGKALLAVGTEGEFYDTDTGELAFQFPQEIYYIKKVGDAYWAHAKDGTLYDIETQEPICKMPGSGRGKIINVDGQYLVLDWKNRGGFSQFWSWDNKLLDLKTGKVVTELPEYPVRTKQSIIQIDGRWLVLGNSSQNFFDVKTGELVCKAPEPVCWYIGMVDGVSLMLGQGGSTVYQMEYEKVAHGSASKL